MIILEQAAYRFKMLMAFMVVFALWATTAFAGVNDKFIDASKAGDLPLSKP